MNLFSAAKITPATNMVKCRENSEQIAKDGPDLPFQGAFSGDFSNMVNTMSNIGIERVARFQLAGFDAAA